MYESYEGRILRKNFQELVPEIIDLDDLLSIHLAERDGVARVLHIAVEPMEREFDLTDARIIWQSEEMVISEVQSYDMPLEKYGDFDVFLDLWTDEEEAEFDRRIKEYLERITEPIADHTL